MNAPAAREAPFRRPDATEIDRKRAIRLQDVSQYAPRHVAVFRRAYEGRSRRAAVHALCVECMGYDAREVPRCSAPDCPLWPYRPGGGR